ncbi:unnamed protein product, partial [Adineta steineri]
MTILFFILKACDPPTRTSSYHQLIKFALLEHRIGLVIDDLKYVFGFMPKLNEDVGSLK